MTAGRPSLYTPELAAEICARMADGNSLRSICSQEDMPGMSTVFRWLQIHTEFQENYEIAWKQRVDAMAEDAMHISDTPEIGERRKVSEDGVEVTYEDMLGHRRLRVDTRKWFLARMDPKRFGDRVQAELTGKDGGAIKTEDVSAQDLARRLAFLLVKGSQEGSTETEK